MDVLYAGNGLSLKGYRMCNRCGCSGPKKKTAAKPKSKSKSKAKKK